MKTGRLLLTVSAIFAAGSAVLTVSLLETGAPARRAPRASGSRVQVQSGGGGGGIRPAATHEAPDPASRKPVPHGRGASGEIAGVNSPGIVSSARWNAEDKADNFPDTDTEDSGPSRRVAVERTERSKKRDETGPSEAPVADTAPPLLPVAFQDPAGTGIFLTPEQTAATDSVQDQFITDIGGDPVDASSPEYAKRWHQSRPVADQRLRAMIGAQAFARWQMEGWLKQKELENRAKPSAETPGTAEN